MEAARQVSGRTLGRFVGYVPFLLVLLPLLLIPPYSPLEKARALGYGVCHQLPAHSYILGGEQLPLCARNTGIYLGFLLAVVSPFILGKGRASRFPPLRVLLFLLAFLLLLALDGINSSLALILGKAPLYTPQNVLRLITGNLGGLALASLLLPLLNLVLWARPGEGRSLESIRELALPLAMTALLALLFEARLDFLLYPAALLSILGLLLFIATLNGLLVAALLGRLGVAQGWQDTIVPLSLGMAVGLLQIAFLGQVRAYLNPYLGLSLLGAG